MLNFKQQIATRPHVAATFAGERWVMVVFLGGESLTPASRSTDLARVEHARRFKARAAAAGEAGDLGAEQARVPRVGALLLLRPGGDQPRQAATRASGYG